jgi:hypothetical protein
MGQYYKPIILGSLNKNEVKTWMYSHDFNNGLKLMEHSWIGNDFVAAFETQIKNNPQRVVWAGDYADPCKGKKTNLYKRCEDKTNVKPTERVSLIESRFIVNHTKKSFVDKQAIKTRRTDDWKIHPLPLLTCEGNGLGGGDFGGKGNGKLVGSWARDIISVESKKPKGFKEVKFNLTESW